MVHFKYRILLIERFGFKLRVIRPLYSCLVSRVVPLTFLRENSDEISSCDAIN